MHSNFSMLYQEVQIYIDLLDTHTLRVTFETINLKFVITYLVILYYKKSTSGS